MAAATVLSLLLLDVHVQVGKTPASAETQQKPSSTTSTPNRPPRVLGPRGERTRSIKGPTKPTARRFAWAPAPRASGYHVEFFKGTARVYSANTTRPELTVPALWKNAGSTRSFIPGEYRWYVWPTFNGARASSAVVQAKLVVR